MASGTIAERNAGARKVSARAAKAAPESAQAAGVRQLLSALKAFRRGDFSVRLPHDLSGVEGELADVFNEVVEINDRMTREFERLGEVVGKQGKINHRAKLPGASGSWAASVDAVNNLITDMVHRNAEIARVIGAAARGGRARAGGRGGGGRPRRGGGRRGGGGGN